MIWFNEYLTYNYEKDLQNQPDSQIELEGYSPHLYIKPENTLKSSNVQIRIQIQYLRQNITSVNGINRVSQSRRNMDKLWQIRAMIRQQKTNIRHFLQLGLHIFHTTA